MHLLPVATVTKCNERLETRPKNHLGAERDQNTSLMSRSTILSSGTMVSVSGKMGKIRLTAKRMISLLLIGTRRISLTTL